MRHGTPYGYQRGCRCNACRRAESNYNKEWRKKHPEKVERQYALARKWRESHREYMREYFSPDRARMYHQVRKARKMKAAGAASIEQVRARVELYGGQCWICGSPYEAIDHVIALTRGGTNFSANLRPICRSCNSRKGNKNWRDFVWTRLLPNRGIMEINRQ